MGFFSGRVTFTRFKLTGKAPQLFDETQLELLANNAAGRQRLVSADGIETGWTAGAHILDTNFELAKNIINDMLFFSLRIDQQKLPSDLLRAYYSVDLQALSANNPSGKPSARQKREARESARERLEHEAKDGRFIRRKAIEIVWDRKSHEIYFGTTSVTQLDRLIVLFRNTFGLTFDSLTSGKIAFNLAELHQQTRNVDDAAPSNFVPGTTPKEYAWILDESSRDFLGNEFLLWLWFRADTDRETLKLSDDTEAVIMLARTLTLECPRGQTGHETITSEGPTKLPEARRAVQSGKMPRAAGITIVRREEQYEYKLIAETLGISGLKLPNTGEDDERAQLDARADQIRSVIETNDLLFEAFIKLRASSDWQKELRAMQKWLHLEAKKENPADQE
ncbi:hypothetical protein KIH39_24715 [Telmatocola sphagniphila]|uniref:Recombination-associated protein RdgC n=1 Tax=Telmatocola sphagniphila TaxID=1123043 RepID=A0A8E6ET58_9BACT|nr:hypothetical protein [Telmatocola sphagniphila]QVL31999.1 hypothetical protein KIH39_24715 [Telmatocola sphagniphila]